MESSLRRLKAQLDSIKTTIDILKASQAVTSDSVNKTVLTINALVAAKQKKEVTK